MSLGLFSTLTIGLTIKTIDDQLSIASFVQMGVFAMDPKVMGGAVGVSITYGLKAAPLVLFSALFSGAFGAELGGPAASYVAVLCATEVGKLVYKLTNVDIIVTPFVTIVVGFFTGKFIGTPINTFMLGFGEV